MGDISSGGDGYLDGQLLIATPVMGDPRFERSVIYMCAHSSEGAMGIIVNRPAGSIDFPGLLVQLDIHPEGRRDQAAGKRRVAGAEGRPGRYRPRLRAASSDYFIKDATLNIDDGVCLTATVDILKAIAKGDGPKHALLALGYAGWARASSKTRSRHNGWLHCDADADLIFGDDVDEKYQRALRKIGIDLGMLSNEGQPRTRRRPANAYDTLRLNVGYESQWLHKNAHSSALHYPPFPHRSCDGLRSQGRRWF